MNTTKEKPAAGHDKAGLEKTYRAAVVERVESDPSGKDSNVPDELLSSSLMTLLGKSLADWMADLQTARRRKQLAGELEHARQLNRDAAKAETAAEALEPTAAEAVRKAEAALLEARGAYARGPGAKHDEAASLREQASACYRSKFNSDYMLDTTTFELAERRYQTSGSDPQESDRVTSQEIYDWKNLGVGRTGKDFERDVLNKPRAIGGVDHKGHAMVMGR